MIESRRDVFVLVDWTKTSSVWDYDRTFDNGMVDLERRCLMVRMSACHVCCPPRIVAFLMKPIWFALLDRRTRQRIKLHDVSETDLPQALEKFGIPTEHLPCCYK